MMDERHCHGKYSVKMLWIPLCNTKAAALRKI